MVAHPTRRNRVYLLGRKVRTQGVQGAVQHYLGRLRDRGQDGATAEREIEAVQVASKHARWGVHYGPSREDIFRQAIESLPVHRSDYAFIDLGAGKGEALQMAAEYGFGKVIGVEYSEALAAETRARGVECVCADATDFALPHEPTVLYLYNPFQGKVMDHVVRNIEQSLRVAPRDLWVVYVNPWEHRKFARSRSVRTIVENWDVPDWEFCIYRSVAAGRTRHDEDVPRSIELAGRAWRQLALPRHPGRRPASTGPPSPPSRLG